MDLDNVGGEEGPLADLASLLDGDGFVANNIPVREYPSGSWGMHTSHDLIPDKTVGGGKR